MDPAVALFCILGWGVIGLSLERAMVDHMQDRPALEVWKHTARWRVIWTMSGMLACVVAFLVYTW